MNKQDLVRIIAEGTGLSQKRAQEGLEGMFTAIAQAMEAGERVALANFGCFKVVQRSPRMGRNLATGEMVAIPPRRAVKFVAGRALCRRLENGHHAHSTGMKGKSLEYGGHHGTPAQCDHRA